MLEPHGHEYPRQKVRVLGVSRALYDHFPRPDGFGQEWPPLQLRYLHEYLEALACQTLVVESHYIDRDHVDDTALFYARSLRGYPNQCQRIHFFSESFDQDTFDALIDKANRNGADGPTSYLQGSYLGFSVVRPLPGSPVGRTVLKTYSPDAGSGRRREFTTLRTYRVHLAAFELHVDGLAFQQQDRGVSACATTALWSALHRVAHDECMTIPTPAEITVSASKYFLPEGRSLPSAGLTVHQISEAGRASGLAPVFVPAVSPADDRAQLHGYISSGFAPVLAIRTLNGGEGHAVCGVGVKLGPIPPQTDPDLHFVEACGAVETVFVHDDRLGPYAAADLIGYTLQHPDESTTVVTALSIAWPERLGEGRAEYELSQLVAMIVPLPRKVRLPLTAIRELGMAIAQAVGKDILPDLSGRVVLQCRYRRATEYRADSYGFGLSTGGVATLVSELVLSRYLGVVELSGPYGPLFDVLIDSTETDANPSVLACVRRSALPNELSDVLRHIASRLGALAVV